MGRRKKTLGLPDLRPLLLHLCSSVPCAQWSEVGQSLVPIAAELLDTGTERALAGQDCVLLWKCLATAELALRAAQGCGLWGGGKAAGAGLSYQFGHGMEWDGIRQCADGQVSRLLRTGFSLVLFGLRPSRSGEEQDFRLVRIWVSFVPKHLELQVQIRGLRDGRGYHEIRWIPVSHWGAAPASLCQWVMPAAHLRRGGGYHSIINLDAHSHYWLLVYIHVGIAAQTEPPVTGSHCEDTPQPS